MTISNAKDKVYKLIDEYSMSGENIPSNDVNRLDYDNRIISLIDTHQRLIATTVKKIPSTFSFNHSKVINLLDITEEYEYRRVDPTIEFIFTARGARAYYFEVDFNFNISVLEFRDNEWKLLNYLIVNDAEHGVYKSYKGIIAPTSLDNEIRIMFGGEYSYNIKNVALYADSFKNVEDVPAFGKFIKFDLPQNMHEFRYLLKDKSNANNYDIEGNRTIFIPSSAYGEYSAYYYKYPIEINESTSFDTLLEVEADACEAIVYGVACDLIEPENVSATRLYARYNEIMANISQGNNKNISRVKNRLF